MFSFAFYDEKVETIYTGIPLCGFVLFPFFIKYFCLHMYMLFLYNKVVDNII